jgi:uncharacterized phage-associated protein
MVGMPDLPRTPARPVYDEPVPAASASAVTAELRRRLPSLQRVQLQKLLYYCQGHHLQTFDEPLFGDVIKAYEMGPVVPKVWKAEELGHEVVDDSVELTEEVLGTIGYVVATYGHMTGNALAQRSHTEPPWVTAWASRAAGGSDIIERDAIRDYFRSTVPGISDTTRRWLTEARQSLTGAAKVDSVDRLLALRQALG